MIAAALRTVDRAPTEAQKAAGNYAKGHVKVHGFDIAIENPRGSKRSGVGHDGKPWSVKMPSHYGYLKRTEGADGDHVDVYLGPHLKSPRVYVVDQLDADDRTFDEHKTLLGFANFGQARRAYVGAFSDGKGEDRIGAMTEIGVDQFRRWLKDGDTTKPLAAKAALPKYAAGGRVTYAEGGALPDAPWASPEPALPDAPWAPAPKATESPGLFSRLASPITGIPKEVYRATADALSSTGHYLNPFTAERRAAVSQGDLAAQYKQTGKGLLSAISIPMAPVSGVAHSLVGNPLSALMPTSTPDEQERMRKAGVPEHLIPRKNLEENRERADEGVDSAISAMGTRGGLKPVPLPAGAPRPVVPAGDLGVTLSEGQRTGELPLIQKEQAALRGQMGDAAQARAQEFANQQRGELQTATEGVAKDLDPFRQTIAETPQEAGQLVSESVQSAAAQRKAGVKQAYDEARSLPGEIHAGAFEDIGQKIKADLSLGDNPIIIDDKLTPFASQAIRDVEDRISKLVIQNRADPFGPPNPENIVGVDLKGVDQMRKRLSAFRKDAFASGNAADGRAAQAVIKAFDNHVDAAVNGGLFKGDPRAIQAWNDARAAHADYMGTFTAGKNDPAGRVVEKILGKDKNPAAIPNDVADFIYGGSGVNPSSLNVAVAKRVRSILGEQSPEWSAVKQGLFSRLVEAGPGATDWGPGKIAQRVNKFLNADGIELSREIFSPQERNLVQQFADLQRKLQVPQAGANWSNTATILGPMLKKVSGGIAALIGAAVGHTIAPGFYGAAEAAGAIGANRVSKVFSDAKQLRQISQQMPLVAESLQRWQRAAAVANRNNTPMTQRTMNIASANLARSLQSIGINPQALMQAQGTTPTRADEKQQ